MITPEESCMASLMMREESVIVNKPEYKFRTSLFLPLNDERKAEGGAGSGASILLGSY